MSNTHASTPAPTHAITRPIPMSASSCSKRLLANGRVQARTSPGPASGTYCKSALESMDELSKPLISGGSAHRGRKSISSFLPHRCSSFDFAQDDRQLVDGPLGRFSAALLRGYHRRHAND